MKYIPDEFKSFILRAINARNIYSWKKLRHCMIIRWYLWQEGHAENELPGYKWCPVDCGKGYPLGWSENTFRRLWQESGKLMAETHTARRVQRPLALPCHS